MARSEEDIPNRSCPGRGLMAVREKASILSGVVKVVVGALAIFYLCTYLTIALMRLPYPFELEWMEGAPIVHVERLLNGQPIYGAPSIDFIPFIYKCFGNN